MKLKNLKHLSATLAFSLIMTISTQKTNAQTLEYKWASKTGSTSNDEAHSIATDASGNIYTTGVFTDTVDMDPGSSTYNLTSNGQTDVYVKKYSSAGALVWAVQIGGTYADNASSIALDGSGNVFITGGFLGTVDFNPGTATNNHSSVPNTTIIYKTFIKERNDIFILKLNNSGEFVWVKTIGAGGEDAGNSIAVDNSNNILVTGVWADLNEENDTLDFNPGSGVYNLTGGGSFVLKLNNSGDFVWACSLGETIDKNKIIYTGDYGYYQALQTAVCKSVTTDASGKIYIAGEFKKRILNSNTDFDPDVSNTYNLSVYANLNAFVWVLNSNGTFALAKQFGDFSTMASYASASDIAVDASGNIYTTGYFRGEVDFDPGSSSNVIKSFGYSKNNNYTNDIFVTKLSSSGNFVWASQFGGQSDDNGYGIDIAGNGSIYCTGHFTSKADFNPSRNTYYLTSKGSLDAFVFKLDASGNFKFAFQNGGTGYDRGLDVALSGTSSTEIYTCGYFSNTVDMDPGTSTVNLSSAGAYDAYVQKINEYTAYSKRTIELVENDLKEPFIYPNPASDIINVELGKICEEGTVIIMQLNGSVILENSINNQQFIEFEIGNLTKGIYFINIISSEINKFFKFVKN